MGPVHDPVGRLRALATRPRVRLIAIGLIAVALLELVISFTMSKGRRTPVGSMLGGDFAAQYVAGTILNSRAPERLYDPELQAKLYHRTVPAAPQDETLPYPYAPFLAVIFRPLAALPYAWAYLLWLLVSMAAYLATFHFTWRAIPELRSADYEIARLVAVSFLPFLFESWMGGQVSAIGALSVATALYLQSRSRPLLGGAALAVCLYKPTLLIMLLPMLLATRRFATLAGFVAGAAALFGISRSAGGWEICRGWAEMLMLYARMKAGGGDAFRTWKYVDLTSFAQGIWPLQTPWSQWMFGVLLIVVTGLLIRLWWRARRPWDGAAQLSWASALTWGCLLSPHYAVYDSILLVPSVLLTAAALRRSDAPATELLPPDLGLLVGIGYATALFAQPVAYATGVQLFTLAILALGVYQMRAFHQLEPVDVAPNGAQGEGAARSDG